MTAENVNSLLQPHRMEVLTLLPRSSEGEGVVNFVYFITTKCGKGLVLRVTNPHPFWKHLTTRNEVSCIKWMRRHLPNVPVAEILASSVDGSLLGGLAEYILFFRSPGVVLSSVCETFNMSQKERVRNQLLDIVIQMRRASVDICTPSGEGAYGSIEVDDDDGGEVVLGPVAYDCPPVGPFLWESDFVRVLIQWAMEQMQRAVYLQEEEFSSLVAILVQQLSFFLQNFIVPFKLNEQREKEEAADNDTVALLSFTKSSLCHLDLHEGNILVDPLTLEITAILDWEIARYSSFTEEYVRLREYYWSKCGAEEPLLDRTLLENGIGIPSKEFLEARDFIMDVAWSAVYTVFFATSWWKTEHTCSVEERARKEFRDRFDEIRKLLMEHNAWTEEEGDEGK